MLCVFKHAHVLMLESYGIYIYIYRAYNNCNAANSGICIKRAVMVLVSYLDIEVLNCLQGNYCTSCPYKDNLQADKAE